MKQLTVLTMLLAVATLAMAFDRVVIVEDAYQEG